MQTDHSHLSLSTTSRPVTHSSLTHFPYRGRFAPSPTGPLHFGSLVAAVASYLCARQHQKGQWLLRIEDVDTQRAVPGAIQSILNTLQAYGFEWDEEVIYQSQRTPAYQEALEALSKRCYPCSCSRKTLQTTAATGAYSYIYPGNCRHGLSNPEAQHCSIRISTPSTPFCFDDLCQPETFCQNIAQEVGDFILKRRDGLFAYQLAVVVDDAWQGITDVVRGADLFDNTPRQIYLQQCLSVHTPRYLHFPVAVNSKGKKLSKQNSAPEISLKAKRKTLLKALSFLAQKPPSIEEFATIHDVWSWAKAHWNPDAIPPQMTRVYNDEE